MHKKTKWIYLPVEVKNRELHGRLLLACCAVERGYSVIIGKKNALTRAYFNLPRGMIIDKAISAFRESDLRNLKDAGFRLCASDEESLGIYREPEIFLAQRMNKQILDYVDYFFAWGEKQAELIRDKYPESSAHIKAVGSHRLDITRPEFHRIHMYEKNSLQQKYSRYILFPSNFSEILNVSGGREYQLWQREKQGALATNENKEFYYGYLNHLEAALAEYVEILPRIRKEFPEHTLIIRPHPGENPDYWIKIAQGMDKTVVIHEGNIIPWLLGAEAMFHHSCTTGLEAYLLGVPGIAYHPCYNPDYDSHLSTRIGPIAKDEDNCMDLLHRAINHIPLPREDLSWLDNYLMRKNNELASDRMLNALEKLDWPEDRLYSLRNAFNYLLHNLMRSTFLTARKIKYNLISEELPITMGTRKWSYTTTEDIQSMIQVLQEGTGRFHGVTARKLTGQVFCLYS